LGNCIMTFVKSKEFILSHQKIEFVIKNNGFVFKFLNIEPFRLVGFSIQLGSFLGSVFTLLLAYFYLENKFL
jgi:hypothetical protein